MWRNLLRKKDKEKLVKPFIAYFQHNTLNKWGREEVDTPVIDLKKEQNSYLYEAFIYPILLVTRPFGKFGCWPTKNCKPRIFSSGGYHFGDFLQLIDQTIHGRLQPFIDAQQFVLLFYETNAFIDKRSQPSKNKWPLSFQHETWASFKLQIRVSSLRSCSFNCSKNT